jgi:hypothetical protein
MTKLIVIFILLMSLWVWRKCARLLREAEHELQSEYQRTEQLKRQNRRSKFLPPKL